MDSMDEYCMARGELMAKVIGVRVRGRQRLGWMDGWCEDGPGQQRDDWRPRQ